MILPLLCAIIGNSHRWLVFFGSELELDGFGNIKSHEEKKSCEEDLLLWLRMAALDCRRRKNGWKDDEDDNALIAWLMAEFVDGIV